MIFSFTRRTLGDDSACFFYASQANPSVLLKRPLIYELQTCSDFSKNVFFQNFQ